MVRSFQIHTTPVFAKQLTYSISVFEIVHVFPLSSSELQGLTHPQRLVDVGVPVGEGHASQQSLAPSVGVHVLAAAALGAQEHDQARGRRLHVGASPREQVLKPKGLCVSHEHGVRAWRQPVEAEAACPPQRL